MKANLINIGLICLWIGFWILFGEDLSPANKKRNLLSSMLLIKLEKTDKDLREETSKLNRLRLDLMPSYLRHFNELLVFIGVVLGGLNIVFFLFLDSYSKYQILLADAGYIFATGTSLTIAGIVGSKYNGRALTRYREWFPTAWIHTYFDEMKQAPAPNQWLLRTRVLCIVAGLSAIFLVLAQIVLI